MALSLMYITNNPQIASIAQEAGVNRIFVDLEYIGKEERQAGMDTVKSHHSFLDIKNISKVTTMGASSLLVRVNPVHDATKDFCSTEEEIETAISCGANIVMLPMFKTCHDVDRFIRSVDGKAKTVLLLETKEAVENLDDILSFGGFDELHIGLNDLHLAYGYKFMFELLSDGTVDKLAEKLCANNIRWGFGGIARIGYGLLPAEMIIMEHYRLGSQAAILSRSFCEANKVKDIEALRPMFIEGVDNIRSFEKKAASCSNEDFLKNHEMVKNFIRRIVVE